MIVDSLNKQKIMKTIMQRLGVIKQKHTTVSILCGFYATGHNVHDI